MRRQLFFFCIVLGMLLIAVLPARAQTEVLDQSESYGFGEYVNFSAHFQTSQAIQEAAIFIQQEREVVPISRKVTVAADGQVTYMYDLTIETLRAFTQVTYWYQLTFQDGQTFKTPARTFYYEDNRFQWQTVQDGPFRVHWYDADPALGEMVLDAARKGMQKAQEKLPFAIPKEIDIYAYSSVLEMQSTLKLGDIKWVVGHADPDLGLMVVSLPAGPNQKSEIQRQIPHEMVHILLYELMGDGYRSIPAWLNEGLASMNELDPNPDYYTILSKMHEKEALIPLPSLCQSFPMDASSAFLAYAESASFVRYLYQRFGADGLNVLVSQYMQNLDCESGVQAAFGKSLAQLDADWMQAAFAESITPDPLQELLPWSVLLAVALLAPVGMMVGSLFWKPKARPSKPLARPSGG